METIEALKTRVCHTIDDNRDEIIALARSIALEPELGYKEVRTSTKVQSFLSRLLIDFQSGIGITGVKGKIFGSSKDICVGLMGELDGVICSDAEGADPGNGASHTCGHNLQIAGLLGAALGLKLSGVMEALNGTVAIIAVPAEEYIEIEARQKLREEGKIRFLSGKQELIHRGAIEDVDMCLMFHALKDTPEAKVAIGSTSNGFIGKLVRYTGKAAHAAEAPHEGVNALNAAVLGITGINALRETFKEADVVRVHPVITKGGETVNSVPADVRMETYVRASGIPALSSANVKVDRALRAGAYAVGAEIEIQTIPGHMPMQCSGLLNDLLKENAKRFLTLTQIVDYGHFNASTDFGDISHMIPSAHPFIGGVSGNLHTKDFKCVDDEASILMPAKLMAMTVVDLLVDGATKAKQVKSSFHATFQNREAYSAFLEDFFERKGSL